MSATTKERPILFSAPMVRAILDGRKTQTRRVVKCECNGRHLDRLLGEWPLSSPPFQVTQEHLDDGFLRGCRGGHDPAVGDWVEQYQTDVDDYATSLIRCPYGKPGDRLWVRETWAPVSTFDPSPETGAFYRADYVDDPHGPDGEKSPEGRYRTWKPSIHMPRWASRIDLEITGVRVERLQDISEADAVAEGSQCAGVPAALTNRGAFSRLWQSINGPDSWAANPWVWVIEFQRIGGAS